MACAIPCRITYILTVEPIWPRRLCPVDRSPKFILLQGMPAMNAEQKFFWTSCPLASLFCGVFSQGPGDCLRNLTISSTLALSFLWQFNTFLLTLFLCLFIFERGEQQRERETEYEVGGAEPNRGLKLTNPWDPSWSQTLNWLNHSDAQFNSF